MTSDPAPDYFRLDEARNRLDGIRPVIADLIAWRADLAELAADSRAGRSSPHGGIAEAKSLEARIDEVLATIQATGATIKGVAPLLLDFPGRDGDVDVLYCWLESEPELGWFHRADAGFAGRRPLP